MTGPEPAEPAANLRPGSGYVALGSSFAAGPGLGHRVPDSPRAAGRSAANYAHLVARRLGFELDDVTFSGATTQDILAGTASGRPAQVAAVSGTTKLVTLTGGGNDVGWAPRILLSSLPRPVRAIPLVRHRLDSYADPDLTGQRFRTLRENLLEIAAQVRRRAPESRLVFVDYLTVLPPDGTTPTGVLPADVAEWGRVVARRLSGITRDVAAQSGSIFVAASAASAGHHAWSASPWTRRFHLTLRGGAPYHPNAAGMAAVAELVAAALRLPGAGGLAGRAGQQAGDQHLEHLPHRAGEAELHDGQRRIGLVSRLHRGRRVRVRPPRPPLLSPVSSGLRPMNR